METGKKNLLTGLSFHATFKKLVLLMPLGVVGMFIFSYFTIRQDISRLFQGVSYSYLVLAFGLSFVHWITHTLRMSIWNRFLKLNIPFNELFKIALGTELGAAITPTSMGGGPVKMGMLVQQNVSAATSLFLTILGSIEDWTFYLLVIPIALILAQTGHGIDYIQLAAHLSDSPVFIGIATTLGCILLLTLLKPSLWRNLITFLQRFAFWQRLFNKLEKMFSDMQQVSRVIRQHGKRYFLLSMVVTTAQWISRYSIIYLLLRGLGIQHNVFELFMLQVIVYLMMNIIPTPGSAVGAEAAFYYIFQTIIPGDLIGFLTAGWRLLTYYFPIISAAIIFLLCNYRLIFSPGKKTAPGISSPALNSNIQLT